MASQDTPNNTATVMFIGDTISLRMIPWPMPDLQAALDHFGPLTDGERAAVVAFSTAAGFGEKVLKDDDESGWVLGQVVGFQQLHITEFTEVSTPFGTATVADLDAVDQRHRAMHDNCSPIPQHGPNRAMRRAAGRGCK